MALSRVWRLAAGFHTDWHTWCFMDTGLALAVSSAGATSANHLGRAADDPERSGTHRGRRSWPPSPQLDRSSQAAPDLGNHRQPRSHRPDLVFHYGLVRYFSG